MDLGRGGFGCFCRDLVGNEFARGQDVDVREAVMEGGKWMDGGEWLLGGDGERGWLGV